MASIILPRRALVRQPTVPVELNRGHPLAEGLTVAGFAGSPIEYVSNRPWLIERAQLATRNGPSGAGFYNTGGATLAGYRYPAVTPAAQTDKFTVLCLVARQTGAIEDMWVSRHSNNASSGDWNFGAPTGQVRTEIFSGNFASALSAQSLVAGRTYACAGSYDGENIKAFINGRRDGITAKTGAIGLSHNVFWWGQHQQAYQDYRASSTQHALLFWGSRALSEVEVAAISANPWQIFKPAARRLYSVPSAAFKAAFARGANTVIQPRL